MYGKRKYGRTEKPVEQPVDNSSVPNFLCTHCRQVKMINTPHIELTALENGVLFMYTKMCKDCSDLLVRWLKS